jgi:hypothetical protein
MRANGRVRGEACEARRNATVMHGLAGDLQPSLSHALSLACLSFSVLAHRAG